MNNTQNDVSSHVLILRLWRESRSEVDSEPEWRALIEHVNTKKRYPVRDMSALSALLAPYADDMGLQNLTGS